MFVGRWDFVALSAQVRRSCDEVHVEVGVVILLEVFRLDLQVLQRLAIRKSTARALQLTLVYK